MEKRLFVNYTAEDRLQMLQDNCTKPLEEYGYNKPLTKEQLKDIKDQLSSAAMTLHDVQEEKAEADKEFNSRIKELKGSIAEHVKKLKSRTTYTCGQCFEFLDREERKVGIYDRDGNLVDERAATMKELSEPDNMFAQMEMRKTI